MAPEHIARSIGAGRYYVRIYPNGAGRSSQPYRLTAAWGAVAQGEESVIGDWGKPEMERP